MLSRFALLCAVCLCFAHSLLAVEVAPIFSDHMVLQREAPVSIWGQAAAGATVTIEFAGQTTTGKADANGTWKISLQPLPASVESRELSVRAENDPEQVTFKDVLVGDVWVGSGQSNMAGTVSSYAARDETLDALLQKSYPSIRLARGLAGRANGPRWQVATPEAARAFSALLFPFGERLHRELNVPIGLIVGAVGGTPSGSWIPPQTFTDSQLCRESIAEFAKTYDHDAAEKRYREALKAWEAAVAAAKAAGEKPRGRQPAPPAKPGEMTRGGAIGGLYERHIGPAVGYRIRGVLWDQGEAGSGMLGVDQLTMMSELIRGWREQWGQGEFPFLFVQKPSGGGCAYAGDDAITRNASKFSPLPINPSFIGAPSLSRYLYVRLMQTQPHAWMVPCSDLGGTIHPLNKWGYGNRAAEVALSRVYRQKLQAYGPTYRGHKIDGDKVIVEFNEIGSGLVAAHSDKLQGFAIAGADGVWHWADATIQGDTVVLHSDKVAKPKHACYAFAQQIPWANLFNKEGKHALCFTTVAP
ncbi:MAG: hypothetical protein KDB14_31320 [Planctomycetales bacterium]|nr:hypothetical protein [Planctomycetales bacterium]